MILAIVLSLVAALPFCVILFAAIGLPLDMSIAYVGAGIVASLVIRCVAKRVDPLRRLKRFYLLGGGAGAAIELLTNGPFAL